MQIITKKFIREIEYKKYFNYESICFIDIETTGLSNLYNSIYLIGILYFEKDLEMWSLTQLLAESINEEKEILLEFIKYIITFDKIITYNGDYFDLPFINNRMDKHNISYEITMDSSIDMYKIVKKNRYYLNLDNLKLKSLESYLGLFREDIYSGKDCIDFYLEFTKTKNTEMSRRVLQHNYDDLYYMIDILRIIDSINEKRTINIRYDNDNLSLYIKRIEIAGDLFLLYGQVQDDKIVKLIHYDNSYKITFDENNNFVLGLECSLGLVSPNERGYYLDKNKIALPENIQDSTIYQLPSNILLLKVEKQYCMDNIKAILKAILCISLKTY